MEYVRMFIILLFNSIFSLSRIKLSCYREHNYEGDDCEFLVFMRVHLSGNERKKSWLRRVGAGVEDYENEWFLRFCYVLKNFG